MSFGVWISMKPLSTQYWRRACSNVVCTRKMRLFFGSRRSRKRQSILLSMPLSAAIGASGMAAVSSSSADSLISMPPSFTRSSCFSSPVARTKEPSERPEIVVAGSSATTAPSASTVRGFTS